MRPIPIVLALATLTLTCCASTGTPPPQGAQVPGGAASRLPLAGRPAVPAFTGVPLLLDRADLALGTTVQFSRIPSPSELHDLEYTYGLARLVLSLPEWPRSYQEIQGLDRRPVDLETIVVLAGWPPSREAAEAWNLLSGSIRLVVLVSGPPEDRGVITDLNGMRGLERVVAQMDEPSRSGFERLQRPLSFRRIVP